MLTVKSLQQEIKANPNRKYRLAPCSQVSRTVEATCKEASGSCATFIDAQGELYFISKGNLKFVTL